MSDIRICPVCDREIDRKEMLFTRDCHGITFRLVCLECYKKLMEKGFDGEYYSDLDETIEPDDLFNDPLCTPPNE